jgi:hypothetical protein
MKKIISVNHAGNFMHKVGNTTYKVVVHFPKDTERTFSDSVKSLIVNECMENKK